MTLWNVSGKTNENGFSEEVRAKFLYWVWLQWFFPRSFLYDLSFLLGTKIRRKSCRSLKKRYGTKSCTHESRIEKDIPRRKSKAGASQKKGRRVKPISPTMTENELFQSFVIDLTLIGVGSRLDQNCRASSVTPANVKPPATLKQLLSFCHLHHIQGISHSPHIVRTFPNVDLANL
jgi:hypothetical protein